MEEVSFIEALFDFLIKYGPHEAALIIALFAGPYLFKYPLKHLLKNGNGHNGFERKEINQRLEKIEKILIRLDERGKQ